MSEKTSEYILGFTTPPDHQCPNIDSYIIDAKRVVSSISDALKCNDIEDIIYNVNGAELYAVDIEGFFEELRAEIETLRQWGQEWKDLAKELIEEHNPRLLFEGEK